MFVSHQWIKINVSHIDESLWKQDLCMPSYCYRLFYHEFQKSEMQQTFFLQLGTSLHIIRQKYLFDMLKTFNDWKLIESKTSHCMKIHHRHFLWLEIYISKLYLGLKQHPFSKVWLTLKNNEKLFIIKIRYLYYCFL